MSQVLLNGLLLGANYALLAVGYTLVFGVLRLLTLAHGQVFMASGLVALVASTTWGVPLAVAGLIAVAVGAALGVATDLLCFRPVGLDREMAAAVSTIGLGIAIEYGALQVRGSSSAVAVPASQLPNTDFTVGPLLISTVQVAILVIAVVVMAGTQWFVSRTRWGVAMRALAENPRIVPLLGVRVGTLTALTMALAGGLAGIASFLIALRNGATSPLVGSSSGIVGLAIMTIGGLGSLPGAMLAGILLGVIESIAAFVGLGELQAAVPWLLLIVVLLVRPRGLLGSA